MSTQTESASPEPASADTPDLSETDLPETQGDVVMTVTQAALSTVLGIRSEEDRPEQLGLRVEITGVSGPEYTYDLSFDDLPGAGETAGASEGAIADPHLYRVGDLTVIIPADSVERLRGAELDLPRNAGQGGLVIRNPNRPDPLAGIEVELSGDVAEKVTQLLEQSINPALAAHGGFATLVGVDEDNRVYVTMGGGCQGCSVSAVTLTEGIKKSILEHIPEVADVIDATDHTAGENPFYS
ncbi:MAG: NifU family protein [Microthrixaceae bacterium]